MDLTWLRELRELREVWLAMRAPRYWKRLRLLLLSGLGAGVAIYTVGLGTVSAWVGSASGAQGAAPTAWRFPALWLLVSFLVGMVLVSTFWVWRAERGGAHGDVLDYYREVPMHFGTIYEGTAFDVLATYGSLLVEPHDVGGWSSEIRGHLVSVATRD